MVAARARTDRGGCLACFPPPVWLLAPLFPLPSPKLELVPQRPRSGGNGLDLDGGGARFGGGKARSEGDEVESGSDEEVRS